MTLPDSIGTRAAVVIFLGFAFPYFFAALLRAVTATLAPVFSDELGLSAADLGLLAGAYFFGFAAMQLPMGRALDRYGPRRVLLVLMSVAVIGCVCFALARSLPALIAARALIGVGVAVGLMAPLTCYRRIFTPAAQLRANSWMLMTGSLGMVASTVPVQLLLPIWGWRSLFWAMAVMLAVAMLVIALVVPRDTEAVAPPGQRVGYGAIVRHPQFLSMAPIAFFLYGGMIAMQSLWAGPWLTRVAGWSADEAARGLFFINTCMLFTFLAWGSVMPRLSARGWRASRLMMWGVPISLLLLAVNVWAGPGAAAGAWAAWCVSSTFVSLSQPAVAQAFPPALAGRALSAFNLVIFGGVFTLQWGLGLAIDALRAGGFDETRAFQIAFGAFWSCCCVSYLWFLRGRRLGADNAY
jgi:predicted MFS family arabinose efflux permease